MAAPPRTGQLDQISESIGSLNARVDGLNRSLDSITIERREDNRNIIDKLEKLTTIANDVKVLQSYIAEIKPIVEDLKQSKSKAAGILLSLSALIGLTGAAAGEWAKWYFLGK